MAVNSGRQSRKVKDVEVTPQTTQSNRKLMRRILKVRTGSNKIGMAWYRAQIARYGEWALRIIHIRNTPLRKRMIKS